MLWSAFRVEIPFPISKINFPMSDNLKEDDNSLNIHLHYESLRTAFRVEITFPLSSQLLNERTVCIVTSNPYDMLRTAFPMSESTNERLLLLLLLFQCPLQR